MMTTTGNTTPAPHPQDGDQTLANKIVILETITAARLGQSKRSVCGHLLPSGFVFATKIHGQVRWSVWHGPNVTEGVDIYNDA